MNARGPAPRRPDILFWLLAILAGALVILFLNHEVGTSFGLANDDFARLAALLAVLVFVGAGFLGRHMKVSQVVRGIALWGLIGLVLIGGYASRHELVGVAGRMLAVLAPGLPVSGRLAGLADAETVLVTRTGNGHFAVRAQVDGTPVGLLVDTGASFVTLTREDAERIGIDVAALDYVVPIHTANGTLIAASVVLDSVAIGPIERRRVKALVAPDGALGQSLLGLTFLDTLGGYAITGDRLVLTP